MVRLVNPPESLLPRWTRDSVELGGSQCILVIDEEKHYINFVNVFSELSKGQFWKEGAISNEIEKFTAIHDDSAAIYDPSVMIQRIVSALEEIMKQKFLFFGVASFEGNAFERIVFDEVEMNPKDADYLMNIYKKKRQKSDYPQIRKGNYVEINFFGEIVSYFSLPNKKTLRDIASSIYSYQGNASGIVCSAQGAANFIILTENIAKLHTGKKTTVDIKNLRQMFHLIERNIITPISWFRIDLGLAGLERIQNWDEIKDDPRIVDIKAKYLAYIQSLLTQKEDPAFEQIINEDLGVPIDINSMKEIDRMRDLEDIMDVINKLNELDQESESVSMLYYPPNILISNKDKKGAAIGGAMALLSMDVGKNIHCIADLRQFLMWASYYNDQDTDLYSDQAQKKEFFDIENPLQLRDLYISSFHKVMKNSHLFLGLLELESNAFEWSMFPELAFNPQDFSRIEKIYHQKFKNYQSPPLEDNYIKLKWFGNGKEYFTNEDCTGILDLAEKITTLPSGLICAGIVCIDKENASFFILNSNFEGQKNTFVDPSSLFLMFEQIENTNMIPLCFFRISFGLETLKKHRFWSAASQYTHLLYVLDNYRKYINELLAFKLKEDKYRIY